MPEETNYTPPYIHILLPHLITPRPNIHSQRKLRNVHDWDWSRQWAPPPNSYTPQKNQLCEPVHGRIYRWCPRYLWSLFSTCLNFLSPFLPLSYYAGSLPLTSCSPPCLNFADSGEGGVVGRNVTSSDPSHAFPRPQNNGRFLLFSKARRL